MKLDLKGAYSPDNSVPAWLPCMCCHKPFSAHMDLKCPFEASEFLPSDTVLILEALVEMKVRQAGRCSDYKMSDAQRADREEDDYRWALGIVLDRWLMAQGIG